MFERAGRLPSLGRYSTTTFPICWTIFASVNCEAWLASLTRNFRSTMFNCTLINSWSEIARFNSATTAVDKPKLPMITIGLRWCAMAFSAFVSMTCKCPPIWYVEVSNTKPLGFCPSKNNLSLVNSHSAHILVDSRGYSPGVVYWARKMASWYRVLGGLSLWTIWEKISCFG